MGKRILVIDPSITIQVLLCLHLCNEGYQVIMCGAPQETVKLLVRLEHAAPDLIFLALDQKKEAYKVIDHLKTHIAFTHTTCISGYEYMGINKIGIKRGI